MRLQDGFYLWIIVLLSAVIRGDHVQKPFDPNVEEPISPSDNEDSSSCIKNFFEVLFKLQNKDEVDSFNRVKELYSSSVCIAELAETMPITCFAELFSRLIKYPVDGGRKEQSKVNREISEYAACVKKQLVKHKNFILNLNYDEIKTSNAEKTDISCRSSNQKNNYLSQDFSDEKHIRKFPGKKIINRIWNVIEEILNKIFEKPDQCLDNSATPDMVSSVYGYNLINCLAFTFNMSNVFKLPPAIQEQKLLRNYYLRWTAGCVGRTSEKSKPLTNTLLKILKIIVKSSSYDEIYLIAKEITKKYPPFNQYGPAVNVTRDIAAFFIKVFKPDPQDPDIQITRMQFDGVDVIVHNPTNKGRRLRPALMYFHGGGWVYRNAGEYIQQTYYLAKKLGAVVVSVDYRRSPEYRFPVPVEDCLTATKYLMKNSRRFNVDPKRIAVIGDSAGGNMAASVSLMLRDKKLTMPKVQVILYPCMQMFDFNLPSYQKFSQMIGLAKQMMTEFYLIYSGLDASLNGSLGKNEHVCPKTVKQNSFKVDLNGIPPEFRQGYERNETKCNPEVERIVKDSMLNPYICPLMASDLKRLPPALIVNNEFDILRDEGLIYGYRLQKSNIPVENIVVRGGFHGTIDLLNFAKIGDKVMDDIVIYLKKKL